MSHVSLTAPAPAETTAPILSCEHLHIEFDVERERPLVIVEDLSLDFHAHNFWSIQGRSGAGKTSILRALAGLTQPTSGTIHWRDQQVSDLSETDRRTWRRKNIGYLDQSAQLLEELTVLENVLLPVVPDGRRSTHEHRSRAKDLLARLGLADKTQYRPSLLSGGERQRAGLVRALVPHTRVLILDEPTASLDRTWSTEVLDLLDERRRLEGVTMLVATHDEHVLDRADTVYRMRDN